MQARSDSASLHVCLTFTTSVLRCVVQTHLLPLIREEMAQCLADVFSESLNQVSIF